MIQIVQVVFRFGPLLFAFGFLAPLTAQIIKSAGWTPPFGLSSLTTGLIIGGLLGVVAQARGRWI